MEEEDEDVRAQKQDTTKPTSNPILVLLTEGY